MIRVTEPLHLMLDSLIMKDLLVMLLRTRLLKTQSTLSSMLRDLSEESSMIQLSKRIWNYGHSRSKPDQMRSPSSLSSIKVKPKSSTLKKSHQWSWPRWSRLLRLSSVKAVITVPAYFNNDNQRCRINCWSQRSQNYQRINCRCYYLRSWQERTRWAKRPYLRSRRRNIWCQGFSSSINIITESSWLHSIRITFWVSLLVTTLHLRRSYLI